MIECCLVLAKTNTRNKAEDEYCADLKEAPETSTP